MLCKDCYYGVFVRVVCVCMRFACVCLSVCVNYLLILVGQFAALENKHLSSSVYDIFWWLHEVSVYLHIPQCRPTHTHAHTHTHKHTHTHIHTHTHTHTRARAHAHTQLYAYTELNVLLTLATLSDLPATPPHLPHPVTYHTLSPTTPPHLPHPLTCHTPSPDLLQGNKILDKLSCNNTQQHQNYYAAFAKMIDHVLRHYVALIGKCMEDFRDDLPVVGGAGMCGHTYLPTSVL